MTPRTPCSHNWIGNICTRCGVGHHIASENRIAQLERELEDAKYVCGEMMGQLSTQSAQLTAHKAAIEKAFAILERAQRNMPAYHEGGFIVQRHDMDGNYIGFENVDPVHIVQCLDNDIREALTAINNLTK